MQLSNILGITRVGVNAWEMGISVPSTQYIVKLAMLFDVSTDYLLGMPSTAAINVSGLSERQVNSIVEVIRCFKENNK